MRAQAAIVGIALGALLGVLIACVEVRQLRERVEAVENKVCQ